MEKMVNKERSPLSHGKAAAISMNLKSINVALRLKARPPQPCFSSKVTQSRRDGCQ